jgi:hypothetical protein
MTFYVICSIHTSVPGVGPNENLGDVYEWETWPTHRWPNVITLEFTINAKLGEAHVLTRLISKLEGKYLQANLLFVPAILLVNLFAFQVLNVALFCSAATQLQLQLQCSELLLLLHTRRYRYE